VMNPSWRPPVMSRKTWLSGRLSSAKSFSDVPPTLFPPVSVRPFGFYWSIACGLPSGGCAGDHSWRC
jgi:hypothetical protein